MINNMKAKRFVLISIILSLLIPGCKTIQKVPKEEVDAGTNH